MSDTTNAAPITSPPRPRELRIPRGKPRNGWKRPLFALMLLTQILGYVVIVQARYTGQGIAPNYFRLSTMSDVFSILFFLFLFLLFVATIVRPARMGRNGTIASAILSAVILWLDLGVRRTPPEDLSPTAALALIAAMLALAATLMTRSHHWLPRRSHFWRVLRNGIVLGAIVCIYAFWYAFFFPTYSNISEVKSFNADAGVIFGAAVWSQHGLGDRPSPTLRERIEMGYELLSGGAIPRIVVTGASAPGELAEAEIAKRELVRLGVTPSDIIEEDQSRTTFEQVRYLQNELSEKQGWKRFVVISDQYHLARVCEMCKFVGISAIGSPSHIHQPFLDILYYRVRESMALLEYWLLGR